jgi:hypothetical protein
MSKNEQIFQSKIVFLSEIFHIEIFRSKNKNPKIKFLVKKVKIYPPCL